MNNKKQTNVPAAFELKVESKLDKIVMSNGGMPSTKIINKLIVYFNRVFTIIPFKLC